MLPPLFDIARMAALGASTALLAACGSAPVSDAGSPVDGAMEDDASPPTDAGRASDGRILSAYHGLAALPMAANLLCGTAVAGEDGMPLVFSVQLSMASVTVDAFRVETAEGTMVTPSCATLAPANEAREQRTVLLAGPFSTDAGPPRAVEVVGDLRDTEGGSLRGLRTETIVALAEGPSLVLVERFAPGTDGFDGECPDGAQIVQLTWEGGVSGPAGADLGEAQRTGIEITLEGGLTAVPVALGDDDPDNHVIACVDDPRMATRVSVAAGLFHDPGDDANPATTMDAISGEL